jgi:hypothetical protein
VLLNARRHAAKRLAMPRKRGRAVKPLAPARTWLLGLGWRRHHPLIDPSEIPGGAQAI